MTTTTTEDIQDLLGQDDAHCEVEPQDEPPCTQPAATRMRLRCAGCYIDCEGNVCAPHRDMLLQGWATCWCGAPVEVLWERPV